MGNGKYELWDYPKVSKTPQGFADYTHKNFSMGETTYSKDIPTKDVPDINNCYIYDNISWVLKGNHASGQKWEDFDHGEIPLNKINVDESSGVKSVKIEINGSNYGKQKPSCKIVY